MRLSLPKSRCLPGSAAKLAEKEKRGFMVQAEGLTPGCYLRIAARTAHSAQLMSENRPVNTRNDGPVISKLASELLKW